MTTEELTTEEPTEAPEPEAIEEPTTATGTNEEEGTGGNEEAAKWRRKLRDTEAERDGLSGQLEAMQRAEVERIASTS